MIEPTPEEKRAIRKLKQLAAEWPDSLWIFCTGDFFYVMRCGENGEHVYTESGCVDQSQIIENVEFPSDGGDW